MAPTHTKRPRLAASASFVGSALEYYDFFIYGTASALVFGKLFFPTANPALGTIAALATFAIGNIGRPIGAAVIGHYGDRIGRKQMLILTLIGMGVCTILIGCLPTYASIGIAAPILLLVLRLLQGVAVSGESGGAITLSMEHAPEHRRAFYASWVNQGAAAGSMLATLAFLGFSSLPAEQFESWGWRVPFLLSAVVVIAGLVIRAKLPESPEFEKVEDHRAVAKFPLVTVLTKQTSAVVRVVFIAVLTVVVPINQVLGLTYGVQSGIPRPTMLMIGLASSALAILTQPVFAIIADRIGRKPVFLTGAVVAAAGTFLFFGALGTGSAGAALVGSVVMMPIGYSMCNAIIPALYAEMFDTRVRYSGVAVAGQLGQIFPGFAPAIAAGLLAGGGTGITVALFVAGCAAVSIITVLTARETKDVATDDLGGLRQQQVSAGAAVEPAVEVR
jgi:MFS family permease